MENKFDEIMTRLQSIVNSLEDKQLPLEEAIALFEEGMGLIKEGEERLAGFDKRIKELLNDEDK